MTAALPYTQMYAGDIPATAVYQTTHGWPVYFAGVSSVYVTYDDRIYYDQAATYDGLLLRSDVTAAVAATRQQFSRPGPTRVNRRVGETRTNTLEMGPTRPGRRETRPEDTRVPRRSKFAVDPTRVTSDTGATRQGVTIGPTRRKRGK